MRPHPYGIPPASTGGTGTWPALRIRHGPRGTLGRARRGFSLLELLIALGALLVVLGPLLHAWYVGSQTMSATHSAAMTSALVAMERIRHDLDQNAYPDGPFDPDSPVLPAITEPGPDDGARIAFWIPKSRPPGAPVKKMLDLVGVSYYLKQIGDTATSYLVRNENGQERNVGGVVLRQLYFNRLQRLASSGEARSAPGFEGVSLPADMIRVTLTSAAKPATDEQMDRGDARQVQTYTLSFLQSVREPTLVNRLRMETGDKLAWQFLNRTGTLPGSR